MPTNLIINDGTSNDVLFPKGVALGLEEAKGYGSAGQSVPASLMKYSKSELEVLLKEREAEKRGLRELATLKGYKHKDQKNVSYCWVFSVVVMMELQRLVQNEPRVNLSPASAGAKITGFQNRGGWGEQACTYISEYGVCLTADWPDTAYNGRQYDTPENWGKAEAYKFGTWLNLRPRSMVEYANLIVQGYVCSLGFNWWGHQVTGTDAFIRDGIICPEILNQWYEGWGDDNYAILQGSKAAFDDGVSCLSATAGVHGGGV